MAECALLNRTQQVAAATMRLSTAHAPGKVPLFFHIRVYVTPWSCWISTSPGHWHAQTLIRKYKTMCCEESLYLTWFWYQESFRTRCHVGDQRQDESEGRGNAKATEKGLLWEAREISAAFPGMISLCMKGICLNKQQTPKTKTAIIFFRNSIIWEMFLWGITDLSSQFSKIFCWWRMESLPVSKKFQQKWGD